MSVPLKFLILPSAQLVAIAGLWAGGAWSGIGGLLLASLALGCDFIEDRSEVDELSDLASIGSAILYLTAALQLPIIVLAIGAGTAGDGALATFGAFFTMAAYLATGCGNVGHELSHGMRRLDREIARLLYAVCLHSAVAIDHVHQHHLHVATEQDPTTARRGESLWRFLARSYLQANRNSWLFEKQRARVKGHPVFSFGNRFLLGHAMELAYFTLVFAGFGWPGVLIALAAALFSIRAIEGFNYIAHYGLVRVPRERCEVRHSWNSRKLISSGFMFNITSHSHHHMEPQRAYWQLRIEDDAPILPLGPVVLNVLTAFPRLWSRTMDPVIADWDREHASDQERALIAKTS